MVGTHHGPLPPEDDDAPRYASRRYAVDEDPALSPESTRDDLDEVLEGRVLVTAT